MPPHTQHKESRTTQGKARRHKVPDPTRTRDTTTYTTPAIQHGHQANVRGTPILNKGDTNTQTGGTALQHPPFHCYATPPRHATPPSTRPHPPPLRGGSRRRIPHHTNTTHTAPHHTPHTQQRTVARHDRSTRRHCSGMSRVRATRTGQCRPIAAHTTAIPQQHTDEKDGHHPLTITLFTFT